MWNIRTIPLVSGVNTAFGTSNQEPTLLHRLLNAHINKKGEIEKRAGFITGEVPENIYADISASLSLQDSSDTGTIPVLPRDLLTGDSDFLNDEMHLLSDSVLYSHTDSGWVPRDVFTGAGQGLIIPTASGCAIDEHFVGNTAYDHENVAIAVNPSVLITLWYESSSIPFMSVRERASGAVLIERASPTGGSLQYAVGVCNPQGGDFGFIGFRNNDLIYVKLTDPFNPVEYTLKTTAFNTGVVKPICVSYYTHDSTKFAVAYRDTVAGLTAFFCNYSTGAVTSTTSYAAAGGVDCCCIEYNSASSRYVIAAGLGTGANNILTKVLNTTLVDQALDVSYTSSDSTRRPIRMSVNFLLSGFPGKLPVNPNTYLMWQLEKGAGQYNRTDLAWRLTSTAASAQGPFGYRHATLLTKIFQVRDFLYVGLGYQSTLQSTMFFINVGPYFDGSANNFSTNIAGRIHYGISKGDIKDYGPPCAVDSASVTNVFTANLARIRYDADVTDKVDFTRACLLTLKFYDKTSWEKVGDTWYIANGSIIKQFDGYNVHEMGVLLFPEIDSTLVTKTGAAGALSAGDYAYRIYYESIYRGKRVRSFAVGFTVTVAANDRVNIPVPTLVFTQRKDVAIVAYRTKVNPNANSPFFRVTSYTPSVANWYANVFNADTVTVQDTLADSAIGDEEIDYLFQGVVGRIVPDNLRYICNYGGRLVAASPSAIYPSMVPGSQDAFEFSDELESEVPAMGGGITAIQPLGNNLAIFKQDRIYVISGPGPDNLNLGEFSEPYLVSAEVGAYNQPSTCRFVSGIAFIGPAGIYSLNEGMQLQFIGADIHTLLKTLVENYGNFSNALTRTVYNKHHSYIQFCISGNYVFTYYFLHTTWTVWKLPLNPSCWAIYNKEAIFIDDNTRGVFKQTQGAWNDERYFAGAIESYNYDHIIELGYIPADSQNGGGFGQFKDVYFLGRYYSGATYTVGANYDDSDAYDEIEGGNPEGIRTYVVTDAPSVTTWPSDLSRFAHSFARQKCSTIRVRLQQSDNKRGAAFSQVLFRFRPLNKEAKVGGARRTT